MFFDVYSIFIVDINISFIIFKFFNFLQIFIIKSIDINNKNNIVININRNIDRINKYN